MTGEDKMKAVRDEFFDNLNQMVKDLEDDEYSDYLIWGVADEENRKTAISALKELRSQFIDRDAEIFINGKSIIPEKLKGEASK